MCGGENSGLNIIRYEEISNRTVGKGESRGLNKKDRYVKLVRASMVDPIREMYHITERDEQKGLRMTLVRSNGKIQDEIKYSLDFYRK